MSGPFAILRFERMSNAGVLAASSAHMARTQPTPNADPARSDQNRVVLGSADPAADVRRRRDEVQTRANSGWGVEVLLSASPEWWAAADEAKRLAWQEATTGWLVSEFGRENVAHLRWHHDETTPHLTGFVVPTKQTAKGEAYSAEAKLGGGQKIAAMQDRYAAAVAHLGLKRGVRGSAAEHTSVREWYQSIAAGAAAKPPVIPAPPVALMNGTRQRWADEQTARVADATRDIAARAHSAGRERKRAGEMAATAKHHADRADRAEKISDRVRDVPLEQIMERWGLERDPGDRTQWRAPPDEGGAAQTRITIKGAKWFDHSAKKGGAGAIDAVAHLGRMPPRDAIAWLAKEIGADPTARAFAAKAVRDGAGIAKAAAAGPAPELPLPPERAPVDAAWPRARTYLVGVRQLPAELVDAEHAAGRLWADARGSIVWPLTDADGRRVGFEWRAARNQKAGEDRAPRGVVPGSRTAAGAYDLPAANPQDRRVMVVEGALDALAARALGFVGRVVGVAGTDNGRGLLRALAGRLGDAARWLVGFDADKAGDRAAADVEAILPDAERRRPRDAADWSEMLARRPRQPMVAQQRPEDDPAPPAPPAPAKPRP